MVNPLTVTGQGKGDVAKGRLVVHGAGVPRSGLTRKVRAKAHRCDGMGAAVAHNRSSRIRVPSNAQTRSTWHGMYDPAFLLLFNFSF